MQNKFIKHVLNENKTKDKLDSELQAKTLTEEAHAIKLEQLDFKTRYNLYLSLNNLG